MPVKIDEPTSSNKPAKTRTRRRAVKIPDPLKSDVDIPNTSDGSVKLNLSMDDTITEFARSNTNPAMNEFRNLNETIEREVKNVMAFRKSVNDTSDVSTKYFTDQVIVKQLRQSRWV